MISNYIFEIKCRNSIGVQYSSSRISKGLKQVKSTQWDKRHFTEPNKSKIAQKIMTISKIIKEWFCPTYDSMMVDNSFLSHRVNISIMSITYIQSHGTQGKYLGHLRQPPNFHLPLTLSKTEKFSRIFSQLSVFFCFSHNNPIPFIPLYAQISTLKFTYGRQKIELLSRNFYLFLF